MFKIVKASKKFYIEGLFNLYLNGAALTKTYELKVGDKITVYAGVNSIQSGRVSSYNPTYVEETTVSDNKFDITCLKTVSDAMTLKFLSTAGQETTMSLKCIE